MIPVAVGKALLMPSTKLAPAVGVFALMVVFPV